MELEADLQRFETDYQRVVVTKNSEQKTSLNKRFQRPVSTERGRRSPSATRQGYAWGGRAAVSSQRRMATTPSTAVKV